mgnify:FL=1
MAALSSLSESHAAYRDALAAEAAREARQAWSRVDKDDVSGSWLSLIGRVLSVVTGFQVLAASRADTYTSEALELQGGDVESAGEVNPQAFAGVASDGRSLFGLLYRPAVAFKIAMSRGNSLQKSLAVGQATLDMAVRTQILDAGRVADGVAIAARPRVGYVRTLRGRGCSRCAVLAGRYYKYNSGFRRHPRCKCIHVPAKGANAVRREGLLSDPREFFDSLSPEEQDRIFTKDGAQAIRDGADISQVVNARRGMTTAGTTTEGTARGFARHRLQGAERLMPETIYRIARSREETIDLLRLHGYII